jgi:hypothetical protein
MKNIKVIITLWLFFSLIVSSLGQTTHYVTNIGDSGAGSLRQATIQAFPNDTIRFNVRGTIFLVSGEISISKNLVIEGPGMDSLTITQFASNRLFNINASNFELTGLTLKKGHSIYSSGTGLTFSGGNLYLKDVKVDSCTSGFEDPYYTSYSNGSGDKGGAVKITGQNITIEDCVFVKNYMYTERRSSYGGCIYILASQAIIQGCLFDENKLKGYVTSTSYWPSSVQAYGGALYLEITNDIIIENTIFSNSNSTSIDPDNRNDAYARGGAVYVQSARNVGIYNCNFNNNLARGIGPDSYGSHTYGGGLHIASSDSLTTMDCLFDNNSAYGGNNGRNSGGAMYVGAISALVKKVEVLNNRSVGSVVWLGTSQALFEDNHVHDNLTGGLRVSSTFSVNNCLFNNNSGSAINVTNASIDNKIVNNTFYQNSALKGAAIYASGNPNAVNVINCTMLDNISTTTNGALAVYTQSNTVQLKNNIISNTAYTTKPLVVLGSGGLVLSGGGNVLRDNSISMFLVQPTDRNATDPRLGTFANHGGALNLFDLQASSPAIDLGGADTLTLDQRRFMRDVNTDAGAFEFGAANPNLPTVSILSSSVIACESDSTALSVSTSGTSLMYQWFFNGTLITGATMNTLSFSSPMPSNTGIYTCEVSNSLDTVMSDSITVLVNPITTGTDVQTACNSYTWIDGTAYTASTNTATHTLTNSVGCDSVVTLNLTINNSTTGTDVQTACNSYTWIDGTTYTASTNTATHTLTNSVGCDSVVTLNLTINNSTTGTDVQTACNSYTWIDGTTYTASTNTTTYTLTNSVGCDSIVTLNLTINNSTTGTDVQTACNSYTWIDGTTYTASTNTTTYTLTNSVGCDSIVTLNLTINNSTTGTDVQTACNSYTWIDGTTYTASTNTATHTLTNSVGCDSIVTLNLTINNSTTGTDVQTACNSYTWIDGTTYTASTNTATHTLTNSVGCDSIVTLNLTINNSTTGTDVQTACNSYTWIDGTTYTASTNTATHTLTNSVGCDSIVTLNLTINTVDKTTTLNGLVLTSNAVGATYQWLDCNNGMSSIVGETNASYTASISGDYAVEITENGCMDTSTCVSVIVVGLVENKNTLVDNFVLYPNPTSGKFAIEFNQLQETITARLLSVTGQIIRERQFQNTQLIALEIDLPSGVYLVELIDGEGHKAVIQLIKQ